MDQVGSLVVLPSQPAALILKVHVHLCNLTTIGRILEGYWQLAFLQNVHHTLAHILIRYACQDSLPLPFPAPQMK